jgi:Fur family iron response transcriptional regulator
MNMADYKTEYSTGWTAERETKNAAEDFAPYALRDCLFFFAVLAHNALMRSLRQNDYSVKLLQDAGLRLTQQRMSVASILFDGTHKHMTAEQVHAAAGKERMKVSLATVYNTLHQFTTAGLLREVVIDRNRIYFDTNTGSHHHFFDESGGHLTDIPAHSVVISRLPKPPKGAKVKQVDVVIHVRSDA